MFEPGDALEELCLDARGAGGGERIARTSVKVGVAKLGERQPSELDGTGEVLGVTLVMDGELFASVDSVVAVAGGFRGKLMPERGGIVVIAPALCEERKVAASPRAEFHW